MPASQRSLALTEAYRARTFAIRERLQALAARTWPTIESLDQTDWVDRMATTVAAGQVEAVRATAGYLTAFLTTELGRRVRGPVLDSRAHAGVSRDGRPLSESLHSPLIGARAALKQAYAIVPRRLYVTPSQAAMWLRGGTHGNLQATQVDDLARKMLNGEWDATQGKIMITRDGFVFDGQHRLEAVVQSGLSVPMLIARDFPDPMRIGLNRATRMIGVDFDHAHRTALLEAIERDQRFEGWERAVRGTCGACAGKATGPTGGLRFEVHPGCQCVAAPVVSGVSNRFPVLTGAAIFAAKTKDEQDAMLGPAAAEKVRAGASLADLVTESPLEEAPNFITQAPASALN